MVEVFRRVGGPRLVPDEGVVRDGHLWIAGWSSDETPPGRALLADGSRVALFRVPETATSAEPIVFEPTRSVDVHVTLPEGAPAAGLWVTLVNDADRELQSPKQVDVNGHVRFKALTPGRARIHVHDGESRRSDTALARVAFLERDVEIPLRVAPRLDVALRIDLVGGPDGPQATTPLAASGIHLRVQGRTIDGGRVDGRVLHFSWRPPPRTALAWVEVARKGYVTTHVHQAIPERGREARWHVELDRAHDVDVHFLPPRDGEPAQALLQRWVQGAWKSETYRVSDAPWIRLSAHRPVRLGPLPPGRYRAVDTRSGVVSETVMLPGPLGVAQLTLDATHAGWIEGRVVAPPGVSLSGARIVCPDSPRLDDPMPARFGVRPRFNGLQAPVEDDGTFRLRVPGDRSLTLSIHGPHVLPAGPPGSVRVKRPVSGVRVPAMGRGQVAIRFSESLGADRNDRPDLHVRRVAWLRNGSPPIVETGTLSKDGRAMTVAAPQPGTWTLWVDAFPFAPLRLSGVQVTAGVRDLGTQTLHPGSTVSINVRVNEGAAPPNLWLTAIQDEPIPYKRVGHGLPGVPPKITGLGAGSFRLEIQGRVAGASRVVEIEVNGFRDHHHVIDLRD